MWLAAGRSPVWGAALRTFTTHSAAAHAADPALCHALCLSGCRAPVVDAQPTSPEAADVVVTPPEFAPPGGWDKYVLTICPTNPAGTCFDQDCTPVNAYDAGSTNDDTTCQLTGLNDDTTYSVEVGASTAVRRCRGCGCTLLGHSTCLRAAHPQGMRSLPPRHASP